MEKLLNELKIQQKQTPGNKLIAFIIISLFGNTTNYSYSFDCSYNSKAGQFQKCPENDRSLFQFHTQGLAIENKIFRLDSGFGKFRVKN